MNSRPEIEVEDWDLTLDPLIEVALLLKGHKQSLFFLVARRREEYFADVEAISQIYDREDMPIPRAVDPLRVICDTPTQPDMAPVEKQPLWPVSLANQPTLILPATIPPSTRALPAARFCFNCLQALLRKCRRMLFSLQYTRKLPITFPGC